MPKAKYAKYPHWSGLKKDKDDPQTIEEAIAAAVGAATLAFLELTDTPAAYAGEAGKVARVNAAATALEFFETGTNTHMAKAYNIANQAIEAVVWVPVNLAGIVYDPGGNFDNVNMRYVAPVDGWYHAIGNVGFTDPTAGQRYLMAITTAIAAPTEVWVAYHASSAMALFGHCSALVHLNAGTFLYLIAQGSIAATIYGNGAYPVITHMSVHLLVAD